MKSRFRLKEFHFLIFPPYFWLLIFFAIPLIIVLICSVGYRDTYVGFKAGFTLEHYKTVFDPLYIRIFIRSFIYAAITTILTFLIAYPTAYFMAFASTRVKYLVMFLVIVPFWTNFLIRMYSWIIILGSEGLVNKALMAVGIIKEPLHLLNNPVSVIIGLVYGELPYMILPIFAALDRLDTSLIEASMDLGGDKRRTFLKITFPLSLAGVVAGVIFVFVPTLGNFVVPDILGGNNTIMIGNVISSQFKQGHNWPFGSALSSVLTFIVMIFIAIYIRFSESEKSRLLEV